MNLKVREELREMDKNSYASDHIELPENGIDCSEGCNPYGFPEDILTVLKDFDKKGFADYPHSQKFYESICGFWKEACNLEKKNIILTDGSISGIYIVNSLFNEKGAKVLGIAPQFSDYAANARLLGMNYAPIYLKEEENFKISIERILDAITSDLSLIYIDNPNNPTGQTISPSEVEKILIKAEENNVCVIIDEAYGDFMAKKDSATLFLEKYRNLIVLRTMSKGFGLAGLRAGYILADSELIQCMNKVSNPYMIGQFGRELAGAALSVKNHIQEHISVFEEEKKALEKVTGNHLKMAATDYRISICLIYHTDKTVDLRKRFLEKGVLTIPGAEFDGLDKSFVRIRMPRKEDFPKLLQAVSELNAE